MKAALTCRLCNGRKCDNDMISDLSEQQDENLTLADYVKYYCRVDLRNDPSLSTKVCRVCRLYIETFITFCEHLNRAEKNSIQRENPSIKMEVEQASTSFQLKQEVKQEQDASVVARRSRVFKYEKGSIKNVMELFEQHLKLPFLELEDLSHITVSHENLDANGKVNDEWIKDYHVVSWNKMVFHCKHCKSDFVSLAKMVRHMSDVSGAKIKIICPEENCQREMSSMNSYVNHVVKNHLECLAYSCIECGSTHYNMACLIRHYDREHPQVRNVFPCIECGYYALNFTQLKVHAMTHSLQKVDDSDDDDGQQPTKKGKQEAGGSGLSIMSLHPKLSKNASANRKYQTFPCDQCNNVLLTKQGLEYHKLVHANVKPYQCLSCPAAFRSKQARDEHVVKASHKAGKP